MRIDVLGWERTVDDAVGAAQRARAAGAATYWLPRVDGIDPLIALAVVAARGPEIGLGVGVVPIQTTHPMVVAQQALTMSQASGGRFTLGVGLSHRPVVEGMWGLPFDRPITRMSEYLDALLPLLDERYVSAAGDTVTAHGALDIAAPPVEVLVAALGPQMLRLAGRRVAGTITWMVGPRTLASLTIPELRDAAEAAGRPSPRVIAGFPVCVTEEIATARERAAARYQIYGVLPSYRTMLDREGAAGPEDVALIGPPDAVAERLDVLWGLGVSRVAVSPFGSRAERAATWVLIEQLCRH
jgi:5,10-methylenetetrahydromethanopterin reductase